MSFSSPIHKLSTDTALMTVGEFEEKQKLRLKLIQQRSELDLEISELDQWLAFAEKLVRQRAAAAINKQRDELPAELALAAPKPTPPTIKLRSNANISAIEALREVAIRIGRQSPQGFTTKDLYEAFRDDLNIDPRVKDIHEGYMHQVMRRFRSERLLAKLTRTHFMLTEMIDGAADVPDGAVVAVGNGFKMVPLSKEERIREATKAYLIDRPNKTSHRIQIADYLAAYEDRPLYSDKHPLKSLAVYLVRWPEFKSDGKGNFTYVQPNKTNANSAQQERQTDSGGS